MIFYLNLCKAIKFALTVIDMNRPAPNLQFGLAISRKCKKNKKERCKRTLRWSVHISEMNITGTLPQAENLKLFVPSLSTQGSTRPKQNIFNVVLMRPDKTE